MFNREKNCLQILSKKGKTYCFTRNKVDRGRHKYLAVSFYDRNGVCVCNLAYQREFNFDNLIYEIIILFNTLISKLSSRVRCFREIIYFLLCIFN